MKAVACSWCCTRRLAPASTERGVWRCASASAAPSTSSCRPRPPITGAAFHLASSTRFRSRSASSFCTRIPWKTSWAIPRFSGGRKVPPPIQRMRADDLMAAVFPDQAACAETLQGELRIPNHPLVKETIDNCLNEAMDLDGLRSLLIALRDGRIQTCAIDTAEPSPFSHEILNANPYAFLDDAPLEERRARAVQLRRTLVADDAAGLAALDPAAITQVADESWPVVRDADELHDALLTL